MLCAHDDVAQVGFVDEQLRLDRLRNPQLDRLLPDRRHHDAPAYGERAVELDPLDVAVPLRPAVDVRPEPPHVLGKRARPDSLLRAPHICLLLPADDRCADYLRAEIMSSTPASAPERMGPAPERVRAGLGSTAAVVAQVVAGGSS